MISERPFFSICIPAYNRARYLEPLLDSIVGQDFDDYEVVICEDGSPERGQIQEIAERYAHGSLRSKLRLILNQRNLGYDGNIRELARQARGTYCLYMGNDDLLCKGALQSAHQRLGKAGNIGVALRSYAWFDSDPNTPQQVVRYYDSEKIFPPGASTIVDFYRRSGVISGFIVNRDAAVACETQQYDGTLYYQMHLTGNILATMSAIYIPELLVLCRAGVPPDFGNSAEERKNFTPGRYTAEARLTMLAGIIDIASGIEGRQRVAVTDAIKRTYSLYFYPYIRDQLKLPLVEYIKLFNASRRMGFGVTPHFYAYFFVGYIIKQQQMDRVVRIVTRLRGKTPALK